MFLRTLLSYIMTCMKFLVFVAVYSKLILLFYSISTDKLHSFSPAIWNFDIIKFHDKLIYIYIYRKDHCAIISIWWWLFLKVKPEEFQENIKSFSLPTFWWYHIFESLKFHSVTVQLSNVIHLFPSHFFLFLNSGTCDFEA